MNADDYFWQTKKRPLKTKSRSKPLPKAKEKYLEAEEDFEQALIVLEIKYEKKFQFKTTKHWRFDFHLIEHRILVEISGGPWSGGRGGKLANKAWSLDRYDDAAEMGFTVVRLERDEDGEIIYSDHTGLPKHYLAGHDVEVFFGEVKRWGADENVKRLVEIAKQAPFVSETSMAACCGNCVIN